jgi:hypothetical protein
MGAVSVPEQSRSSNAALWDACRICSGRVVHVRLRCGAVGVCEGCLAKQGGEKRQPASTVAVWCRTHHETVCGKRMPLSGAASLAV